MNTDVAFEKFRLDCRIPIMDVTGDDDNPGGGPTFCGFDHFGQEKNSQELGAQVIDLNTVLIVRSCTILEEGAAYVDS
jgi:hypothetical protein